MPSCSLPSEQGLVSPSPPFWNPCSSSPQSQTVTMLLTHPQAQVLEPAEILFGFLASEILSHLICSDPCCFLHRKPRTRQAGKESSFVSAVPTGPPSPKAQGVAFSCFSFIPSPRSSCSHFLFGENRMGFISFSPLMPGDELILRRLPQEAKQWSNNSRQA